MKPFLRLSLAAMHVLTPTVFGAWYVDMIGVYYKRWELFTLAFGLNIALGTKILLFHVLSDKMVRN